MKKKLCSPDQLLPGQLVESFKKGNQHAFEELIKIFDDPLDHYLTNCNVQCREDREDLRQLIWATVAHKVSNGEYLEQNKFYAWLGTLAYHKAMEYHRKNKAHQLDELRYLRENVYNENTPLPYELTPEQLLDSIHLLTEKEQTIIRMYDFEGMRFRNIAEQLHLKLSDVTVCHSRAIHKLREYLLNKL